MSDTTDPAARLEAWLDFAAINRPGYDHMRDISYTGTPVCDADLRAVLAELEQLRDERAETRVEWAVRSDRSEAFCATEGGALRIASDWNRIRSDGPWRAESRLVGPWRETTGADQ